MTPSGFRAKIMVAEDEADIARLVSFKLKAAGYEVVVAADGQQTMDVLSREMPDLLLLDAMMPIMDGWHVLGRIRTDDRFRRMPVIMFTAQGQERDQIRGRAAGAQDFIVKPFAIGELLPRIEKLLPKPPATPEAAPPEAEPPPPDESPKLVF